MKQKILIVEDNVGLSQMQKDWLLQAGYEVTTAIDEPAARRLLRRTAFDLILSDVRLPEGDGISLLEWTRGERMTTPYIVMTEYATVSDAVRAIRSGAKDYLPKPVHKERLLEMADEILHPLSTVQREEKVLFRRRSAQARHVERLAALVAPSDMSVLILGANGTGKESVARNIHRSSERRSMPFVAVNCGVLPKGLAPSLFFGHVKGAFTGADANREGYFGMAEGGTLFLDEIGTMPYEIQAMLLRVLQENTYLPSAANGNGKRTCGSSRPRTRIWQKRFGTVVFGRTCTTGSASSRSGCRSSRSVPTTSCRSRSSFGSATRKSCGAKHAGSRRMPPNGCSPTHGRATYGSCRTRSSGRCCWPKAASSVWRTWDWSQQNRQATRGIRWPSGTRRVRNAVSSKP